MTFRTRIGIGGAMAILAAAVLYAQDVSRDFDKSYDFTKIKTYAMKLGTSWNNQLSENRVMTAVSDALTQKGWKKTDPDNADALVVLHGATDMKHNITTFYDGWGGWGYGGYGGMSMGTSSTMVSDYKVGTLVVDIFDNKSRNLIFRGQASDEINQDPSKNEKKITKATQKLFKDFPPKEKK